jgi:hypothetical protein
MRRFLALGLLAWWVMVRLYPYLGPFYDHEACLAAATDVRVHLNVPAFCEWRSY